jgi:high-affinity nickel-transport protein
VKSILNAVLNDASADHPAGHRRSLIGIYGLLGAMNLAIWVWAFIALADRPALLGTAFLAYVLGLRHAVDADHIAAIDNVVRKLMQEGKRPYAAGLYFALGHSLAVGLAAAAIAATAAAIESRFEGFRSIGGMISTSVSAFFLIAIAAINLVILRGVWRSFRRARRGEKVLDEELDLLLAGRGFLSRLLRPLFRMVTKSSHMLPLGFLFGLGFDTATEISLFAVAAGQASGGMSFQTVMIFPALFAAGMTLLDTSRKIWYNLTITAVSVAVAFLIGGIEALGLIADKFGLDGGFWKFIGELDDDLADLGFVIVGIFVVSWALSFLIYKWRRFEELPAESAGG